MSATRTAVPAAPATVLGDYRDDGPMSRAVGRSCGPLLSTAPLLLTVLALLPLAVVLLFGGAEPTPVLLGGSVAWLVAVGGAGSGRPNTDRLDWLVPSLLRAIEYAALLRFAAISDAADPQGDGAVEPLAFALIAVLAFHHYDTVYRLRHQGVAPPAWLVRLGGGWDGRLLVAFVLLQLDALQPGLLVAAVLLGAVYAAESTRGWLRFSSAQRPAMYADEQDEDE